ncbi:MAG: hypothetical protein V3U75_13420 [Methylococcaceae bacterium]
MKIGDKIKYIRHTPVKQTLEGEGYVKAFGIDHEQRVIVLVVDLNGQVFHVFERGVNPTDEFKEQFIKLVADVDALTTTSNATIKELTDKANTDIGKMHDDILGAPIVIPVAERPVTNQPPATPLPAA